MESTRFPYLPLTISAGNRTAEVEALLDTGFDGDVAVPREFMTDGQEPDQYLTWTLGDGSEVLTEAFLGTAAVGTFASFPILISAIGDEPLVGRGISDRFSISLDHGRRLIVEP